MWIFRLALTFVVHSHEATTENEALQVLHKRISQDPKYFSSILQVENTEELKAKTKTTP